MIEICAYSLESCKVAVQAEANRIELCGGINEGGTTPSAGLVTLATEEIELPIRVMLRPRGGDFCYSADEWQVIFRDAEIYKTLKINGFVVGALTPDGEVDTKNLQSLLASVGNSSLQFAFHRAFDVCKNPFDALEQIIDLGFSTILTSGQQNYAIDALPFLEKLIRKADNRIEILIGSGVNAQNAEKFLAIGANALHLSGKGLKESQMVYRKTDVSMASSLPNSEFEIFESDLQKCREMVKVCREFRAK